MASTLGDAIDAFRKGTAEDKAVILENEACVGYACAVEDVVMAWEDRPQLESLSLQFRQSVPEWRVSLPPRCRPHRLLELIRMRLRVLSPAQPKPTATQHPLPAPTTRHAKWEERDYATATSEQLVEHARTHWHDADVLCQVNIQFMSQRHPDSWSHLANEVHQIEMQLTVLIKGPSRTRKPDDSNVDAVVEWPHEAMAPQAVALAGDQFTYSKGLLSYMGYRVGKDATLTPERRHRILDYVIGGALPQVNDRQYMRTWGRPRSAARLRKLANVLATFARNARRKQGKNYSQAIAEWEADLAYLKKRHYSRRSRDWKWPKTGLAKRK